MKSVIDKIKDAIRGTNFEGNTYIAGGYVRDIILKNHTSDLDIAVALPQGGIRLAQFLHKQNIATKPVIFNRFGTAQTIVNGHKIEFVMTRNESYRQSNRKPTTSPGSLEEDIFRRDFTINSLIMDIMTGEIHDITGKGIDDLNKKIIRATSNPDLIFHDDPLRILRAVRFANRLGFEVEKITAEAMKRDSYELTSISWERKRDEFIKILLSNSPDKGILLLYKFHLMKYIIPELEDKQDELYLYAITQLPVKEEFRIAALMQILTDQPEYGTMIDNIIDRVKLSIKVKTEVKLLVHYCHYFFKENINDENDLTIRKLVFKYPELIEDLVIYLTIFSQNNKWTEWQIGLIERIKKVEQKLKDQIFPLNGNIIKLELGLSEGKEIGCLIEKALNVWLMDPDLDKDALLNFLKGQ